MLIHETVPSVKGMTQFALFIERVYVQHSAVLTIPVLFGAWVAVGSRCKCSTRCSGRLDDTRIRSPARQWQVSWLKASSHTQSRNERCSSRDAPSCVIPFQVRRNDLRKNLRIGLATTKSDTNPLIPVGSSSLPKVSSCCQVAAGVLFAPRWATPHGNCCAKSCSNVCNQFRSICLSR